ncbi:hypothetical protein PPYR_03557 [Photinus pyralis]|uniref:Amine oxidase domain-containing protein n=1 Tax=Photinus pyralis TaxID=7054 RepID=A0A5N4A369_PHOPY|nr:hypothetical protein PPYR_03557 [Photinus pyralis]
MSSPRIVVIGAGASGIAAATRLAKNGFSNITILEAEDRIGGRICSVEFENDIVDLGAELVREGSLVYDLVKDYDVVEPRNAAIEVYHPSLGPLPKSFVDAFVARFTDLLDRKDDGISWQEYFDENYQKCIVESFRSETEKHLAVECRKCAENLLLFHALTFPLSEGGERFGEAPLTFQWGWKTGGYRTFLDILMKDCAKFQEKIVLSSEVIKIDWQEEIKVACSNGSTYLADHVIATLPLGALKRQYRTLFQPPLPMEKAQAIELLRLQSPSQILVHFPSKWWGSNDMVFTWTEEEMDLVDFEMGPKKNGRSWVTAIMSYYVYPSYKNCLAVYNGGEMVQEMEQMDETVWLEGLHYLNQKFLARAFPNICKPTKIARFKWYSNLHFGGVIATETLESKLRGIGFKTMAEPLLDKDGGIRVLFAGEVTNDSSHAFVNAAVYTGFREADRIINFYKK